MPFSRYETFWDVLWYLRCFIAMRFDIIEDPLLQLEDMKHFKMFY